MKKWIFIIAGAAAVILVVVFLTSNGETQAGPSVIDVTRGSVVRKALAVGSIVPETEISIKSKISGVVKSIHAEPGDRVRAGDVLMVINPDPTPLEMAEARQRIDRTAIALETVKKEYERQKTLLEKDLVSAQSFEAVKQRYDEARLARDNAREYLDLLQTGSAVVSDTPIESVVRAPIDGVILQKHASIGDPVVPLTSYQVGTALMTMADMEKILFKGTVDEIDVGKLEEGMTAEIHVGALPNATVNGTIRKISLKGEKRENATVFPIEITIDPNAEFTLRAGYSANADVIIERHDDVLTIPERLVRFRGDTAVVRRHTGPGNAPEEIVIGTGLSDAITIEVTEGLSEDDQLVEWEIKQID